jgi:hypothetical protein
MTKTNLYNAPKTTITYPESDGLPMANNTEQFHLITTIEGNLEILFAGDPQVFAAGDLLWYPVEGDNTIRQAPDVMVALGRPKGRRGSYLQWPEEGIAPQWPLALPPKSAHGKWKQSCVRPGCYKPT